MSKETYLLPENSGKVFAMIKGPHAKTYHIFRNDYIKALCSESPIDDKTLTKRIPMNQVCQKCLTEHMREVYGND